MKTRILIAVGAAALWLGCLGASVPATAQAHDEKQEKAAELPALAPYQQAAALCSTAVFPPPRGDDPPAVRAAYGKWTPAKRAEYERCMAARGVTKAHEQAFMRSIPF